MDQGERAWESEALRLFRARLWSRRQRGVLPVDDEFLSDFEDHNTKRADARRHDGTDVIPLADPAVPDVEVFSLVADAETAADQRWIELHRRFTAGASGPSDNSAPFNRCLSVLAGHGAVVCVIEKMYVCLDYKSEVLSFYAQLDQARSSTAVRLHFFAEPVSDEQIHHLSKPQRDSYLGYIVCRDGNLPLVGRTLIRTPAYIDTAAVCEENVHFFAQSLTVRGMPFMQQDARLAVCAQVAVWAIHHAAYLAGRMSRRLIADIVALSGAPEPMRPSPSDGLPLAEALKLLRVAGLSAHSRLTPNASTTFPMVPVYAIDGFSKAYNATRALMSEEQLQSTVSSADAARTAMSHHFPLRENVAADKPALRAAAHMFDLVLAHYFEPYLRSNMPVYAEPTGHAVVVCGLNTSPTSDDVTFFVHDDQFGPYLATHTLMDACHLDFELQGYRSQTYPAIKGEPREVEATPAGTGPDPSGQPAPEGAFVGGANADPEATRVADIEARWPKFPADRAKALAEGTAEYTDADVERSILAFIISGPSRVVLTAREAELDCLNMIWQAHDWPRSVPSTRIPFTWHPRMCILMGIDYKARRRDELLEPADGSAPDEDGARFFASLHLAEWVLVIEDAQGGQASSWEVVYDATSGEEPIVQMARYGRELTAQHPHAEHAQAAQLARRDELPWIDPPVRVGKR